MPFAKDDIDAVSITLLVDGETAFQIYLTRGGLTQRMGFSERLDPGAILLKGGTDCFEPFLATIPERLLAEGADMDAGPGDGPRHDWRFEMAGGMNSLMYDITYHAGSSGLPDEFADIVVQAERLTHSWYTNLLAEETGAPLPSVSVELEAPRPRGAPAPKGSSKKGAAPAKTASKSSASKKPEPKAQSGGRGAPSRAGARPSRAGSGHRFPVSRERMGLAILIDFIAWMIPYQFLAWIIGGGGERSGPPGAGVVIFVLVEFLLLQVARTSAGYWLLGISAPHGSKPQVDSRWPTRESNETLALGIGLLALGVAGFTSWTLYHTPVPYFGLALPLWLSIGVAVLGSVALVLAGSLVLRLELLGVWVAAGVGALALLAAVTGFAAWGGFVDAAVAARSAYEGSLVGDGILGIFLDFMPVLVVVVPVAILAGAFVAWKRLGRPMVAAGTAAPSRS